MIGFKGHCPCIFWFKHQYHCQAFLAKLYKIRTDLGASDLIGGQSPTSVSWFHVSQSRTLPSGWKSWLTTCPSAEGRLSSCQAKSCHHRMRQNCASWNPYPWQAKIPTLNNPSHSEAICLDWHWVTHCTRMSEIHSPSPVGKQARRQAKIHCE